MTGLRVALLSSCTIEVLERPFASALRDRGFSPSFWVSGFGQYEQDILDSTSALYSFAPEIVVLYLDGDDLFHELLQNPFASLGEARRAHAQRIAARIESLVDTVSARLPGATIIVNTVAVQPLNALTGLEYNSEFGIQDAVDEYNGAVARLVAGRTSVVVVDVAGLIAWCGFSRWRDARMWYLARLRLSRLALDTLASSYTAAICARMGKARKCVAVDLDNTLWGGIIGEDGIEGIRLGEDGIGRAFVEFQEELLESVSEGCPADDLQQEQPTRCTPGHSRAPGHADPRRAFCRRQNQLGRQGIQPARAC